LRRLLSREGDEWLLGRMLLKLVSEELEASRATAGREPSHGDVVEG
jgi:hypothetical protein